jgi:hypothetical protein
VDPRLGWHQLFAGLLLGLPDMEILYDPRFIRQAIGKVIFGKNPKLILDP